MRPLLEQAGIDVFATLATEIRPNNFPRLPVREAEQVFVWVAAHRSVTNLDASERRLSALQGWRDAVPDDILAAFMRKPERLRMIPTAVSALTRLCAGYEKPHVPDKRVQ